MGSTSTLSISILICGCIVCVSISNVCPFSFSFIFFHCHLFKICKTQITQNNKLDDTFSLSTNRIRRLFPHFPQLQDFLDQWKSCTALHKHLLHSIHVFTGDRRKAKVGGPARPKGWGLRHEGSRRGWGFGRGHWAHSPPARGQTSILCQVLNGPKVAGQAGAWKCRTRKYRNWKCGTKCQGVKMQDLKISGSCIFTPWNMVLHFPYFLLVLVLHLLVLHFQSTRPGTWVAYMGVKMDGPHLTALV